MTKAPRVRNGCRVDGSTRLATGACAYRAAGARNLAQGEEAVVFALLALASWPLRAIRPPTAIRTLLPPA